MKRIRKQVYNLTLKDLERFPVWVFALDEECTPGQDEATVRPWEGTLPFDPREGLNIVRSNFWLADGTHAIGYLGAQVPIFSEIGHINPTMVTPRSQVWFWFGVQRPESEQIREAYELLGKDRSQVFPLRYESAIEITTGPVSGVINGFLHFRSINHNTIESVT
jgi:hypothetical protein